MPLHRSSACSETAAMSRSTRLDDFEDPPPERGGDDGFILRLEAYEGPIDVLLDQAREQKVDLSQISILALADQYLGFIERARTLRLDLAADYLVMAAWLAYLKSRLLLPENPDFKPINVDPKLDRFAIEGLAVGLIRNGRIT